MDAGMLFDMDNLDATILPASNRTMHLPTLPSNDKLDHKIRDIPQTPRAHLHPMTNYNDSQHSGHSSWDRHGHLQATKQWPQLQENHYSSPQSLKERPSNQMCATPGMQYRDPSSSAAISFLSGMYGVDSPTKLSPAQSREDLQWQMYLTASLSNPFNSLGYPNPSSSPLPYPSAMQEHYGTDTSLPIDSTLFPSSNSSAFCPNQTTDIFNSPPFVGVSQMPSNFSLSSSQSHHSFVGISLPQHQDNLLENPVSPTSAPNGTYASLLGLTPLENFGVSSSLFTPPPPQSHISGSMTLSPPQGLSPPRGRSQVRIARSPDGTRGRRGLSGWNSDILPEAVSVRASLPTSSATKRLRSTSASPGANIRRPYQTSPLSTNVNTEPASFSHQSKRPRPPNTSAHLFATEEEDSEGEANNPGDDSESDDYRPSRSPSPEGPITLFGLGRSFSSELSKHTIVSSTPTKRKSRRGKGKAKGSAALALAVVTQLGTKGVQSHSGSTDKQAVDSEEFDAMALYQEGRTGIRKRKNNPIPLPVPIPNLNKKSRGRKVPFVADLSADSLRRSTSVLSTDNNMSAEAPDDVGDSGTGYVPRSTRGAKSLRRTSTPTPVVDDAGCRTYVCVIIGCGKCFVRGEHLKRHVRSIHTHDKPHPCPYEGCDKSFSRRDNLGQHVRIHLQP